MPPPWLELTTSEPSVKATRVRPPGTIFTPLVPDSAKGRKSTWRGETPLSNEAGQVESASVGWAMKLAGIGLKLGGEDFALRGAGVRADQHAIAAGAVDLLDDEIAEIGQHMGKRGRLPAAECRHVLQQCIISD